MRKAAMLILFALLPVALLLAQNPGNANTPQTTAPQTQNGTNPTNSPEQNTAPAPGSPARAGVAGAGVDANPSNSNTQPQDPTQPTENKTAPSSAVSQNAPAASTAGEVPAGTEMRATLDTPLSSKTSKPGDRFTATVSQPVQGPNGVVVPTGARVEGEVSESEQGKTIPALRGKGKLNLRFRDIVLPNGQTVPLVATLVSVNSTNGKNTQKADNEGQVESGMRGKDVAKDVGIGAGVGTVAGLIFGGPLKGLAIGALAGGGYVLATNGKDVNLPAQTGLVIHLDQALSVP